jgi:PDZ domain-containing protein
MPRPLKIALVGLALIVVFAVGWVRLPYYALGPGPARDVPPLISFDGPDRYDTSGHLIMTTVSWYQVTPLQALATWLRPDWKLVSERVLYPPGTTQEQEHRRAISDMDESKIDAAYVVLSRLTHYPKDRGKGVLIESTYPGCPADGMLFPGDVVSSIDETRVGSRRQASRAIDGSAQGEPIEFTVSAAGQTHRVELTRRPCVRNDPEPHVGIDMVDAFPFPITIQSGDIGGPSAGLMYALGLYELMTPGDLTAGRIVAGTGTIDLDGNVGPIGGIDDKVVAARESGASMFLAPADNMDELEGVDTGDMQVISISSFDDALTALGQSPAAAEPTP